MIVYLTGSLAGRVAAVLCMLAIALPYLLRRNWLDRAQGLTQEHAPYLHRLWPHFWIGYIILVLSTVHAGTVTNAMGRANRVGIWAATAAFFLLVFEIVLGLSLKDEKLPVRRPMRRLHFWTMAALVGALGLHLWLNG